VSCATSSTTATSEPVRILGVEWQGLFLLIQKMQALDELQFEVLEHFASR
jgi:hypothetical protein